MEQDHEPKKLKAAETSTYREAVAYFRNRPGFHRLFCALKEKYRSLGTLGGRIRLTELTPEERTDLAGFLRQDFAGKTRAIIKVADLAAALGWTKFHHLSLEEILHGYWGEELLSKKEERSRYRQDRERFFASVLQELPSAAAHWLRDTLAQKENAYKILATRYDQDREGLSWDLKAIGQALAKLPCLTGNGTQIALFAAEITADPHFFDKTRPARQLFLYALSHYFQVGKPGSAFAEAELLYKGGLFNTEISNYTICLGLLGREKGTDLHPGWAGFYQSGETLQLSLENLSRIEQVTSPTGFAFVLENPAVFSALADRWRRERGKGAPPLVCTNGQVNLATIVLLELLSKSGAILYYSGDFDPEGLLIADRLKARFGKGLRLSHYSVDDYDRAISERKLSAGRLKQLERLEDNTLKQVGQEVLSRGYAGYQELLIDDLWVDLKELMEHCSSWS